MNTLHPSQTFVLPGENLEPPMDPKVAAEELKLKKLVITAVINF